MNPMKEERAPYIYRAPDKDEQRDNQDSAGYIETTIRLHPDQVAHLKKLVDAGMFPDTDSYFQYLIREDQGRICLL